MVENLAQQTWLNDPRLTKLFVAINAAGGEIRVAGGAVRNGLLGIAISDIDAATTLKPEMVMKVCTRAGFAVHPTGLQHGTVTVVIEGLPIEVTTLRRDVETDGRHAVVVFSDDWHADAMRRDFTINALYCDLLGRVFDETGCGLDDIAAKRVVFVGDANERIKEDYLRILRFFRFGARFGEGQVDSTGLAACVEHKAGLQTLSVERIWAELSKTLIAVRGPAFVALMEDVGILQELIEVHHPLSDLMRLAEIVTTHDLAPNAIRRLGAITDVADHLKLSTVEKKRFKKLRSSCDLTPLLNDAERRLALYELGQETYEDCVLINWASGDDDVENAGWFALYQLAQTFDVPVFPVGGKDLLEVGIQAGADMGRLLVEMENEWKLGDFQQTKDQLIKSALRK